MFADLNVPGVVTLYPAYIVTRYSTLGVTTTIVIYAGPNIGSTMTPVRNPNAMLTQQPMRVTTHDPRDRKKYVAQAQYTRRWVRGPIPLETYLVPHPLAMECNLCTFVLERDGLFRLKYCHRGCRAHAHLCPPQEVT